MVKRILQCFVILVTLAPLNCKAQNENISSKQQQKKPSKFFMTAGYGLAGSFFVRSYDEWAPVARYRGFYKKKFIGSTQNLAVGYSLKNNWDFRFGINFQHFTRHINTRDTLSGVLIVNYQTIHHRDYMWFGSIHKSYPKKTHLLSAGLGLYYFRSKQQEIDIYPRGYINVERDYKSYGLEEGGAFAEFAYEYKFQPKVNIGIKSQFYYTISTVEPESVTLFPYIKINF